MDKKVMNYQTMDAIQASPDHLNSSFDDDKNAGISQPKYTAPRQDYSMIPMILKDDSEVCAEIDCGFKSILDTNYIDHIM
jgi:hypothetical protein